MTIFDFDNWLLEQARTMPRAMNKGGTTQAATDVFMKKDISGIFTAALRAARDRARKLSK